MRRSALRALRSSLAAVREEGAAPLVRTAAHWLLSFPHFSSGSSEPAAAASALRHRLRGHRRRHRRLRHRRRRRR